jgi:5-formyltetrahydrofolate cyclo-ligase
MKSKLRKEVRERLAQMDPMTHYARSLAVCKRVTSQGEFQRAEVIMIFLSLPDEIDTATIALGAWQMGKTVVAPKIYWEHRRLTPVEITSLDTTVKVGPHNIPEPPDSDPVPLDMIDLILVPGLVFDRKGNRIGRGLGFYDRFLAQEGIRAVTCGLAFREQLVDDLSCEPHDRPIRMLITDEETLRFNG